MHYKIRHSHFNFFIKFPGRECTWFTPPENDTKFFSLFSEMSRPSLGPTQSPIRCVSGFIPFQVKLPEREADLSPQFSNDVKSEWSYNSAPPIRLHFVFGYKLNAPWTYSTSLRNTWPIQSFHKSTRRLTDKMFTLNIFILFVFGHRNILPAACPNLLNIFWLPYSDIKISTYLSVFSTHCPTLRFYRIEATFRILAVSFFRPKGFPNWDVNKDKSELMNKWKHKKNLSF